MNYHEMDIVPAYEPAVWEGDRLVNKSTPVKWSGKMPPPPVGTKIVVKINNCGPAIVTGYFVEHGWLGVRCRLLDPPKWHIKQNRGNPNGHAFGAEIDLVEVA